MWKNDKKMKCSWLFANSILRTLQRNGIVPGVISNTFHENVKENADWKGALAVENFPMLDGEKGRHLGSSHISNLPGFPSGNLVNYFHKQQPAF